MAVRLDAPTKLLMVPGVRVATVSAGIKYRDRRDLVLFELAQNSRCAAVFTTNAFCAAPVTIAKRHLAGAAVRYLVINTGNANAGTGEKGVSDALNCCRAVAQAAGCAVEQVLPFSTGVIGEPLPVQKIIDAVPAAFAALDDDGWLAAARGIMTTDTVPKGASRELMLHDEPVKITGIAKGAGMISPNMATMLAFIATDATIDASLLQACLSEVVAQTFNRVTIDGDTSTNDACLLIASGAATASPITDAASDAYTKFREALHSLCLELAQAIVRDGEGATKFVSVQVRGGRDPTECENVARTIANSPLVKTALFASDPNWGRILAAVGRAGVDALELDKVAIYLNDVCIVRRGMRAEDYTEQRGQDAMARDEIVIRVELGRGEAQDTVWTCDFSYDYVKINAEYRT